TVLQSLTKAGAQATVRRCVWGCWRDVTTPDVTLIQPLEHGPIYTTHLALPTQHRGRRYTPAGDTGTALPVVGHGTS
ncbi:hypothetical protein NHX12_034098, partial [Muraenolepis orangiensis]